MVVLGNDWDALLAEEFTKDYYLDLRAFLLAEYRSRTIFPDAWHIFDALKETPFETAKVVLLGQDPYHGPGQAHGMSFSVLPGTPKPPSLVNIFKELQEDLNIPLPREGYLLPWAHQGVLLLNAVLTVRSGSPNSHRGRGWEQLTDRVLQLLDQREQPLVFLLWGAAARAKKSLLKGEHHCILEAPHPSPLSAYRGFFGCRHFSKTNDFLRARGLDPVDWSL